MDGSKFAKCQVMSSSFGLRAATCSSSRLSGFGRPVMLRGPGGQSVHLLETAALLPPHVVDLHGRLALRHQIQVLLRQVSPQLPDFKLWRARGDAVKWPALAFRTIQQKQRAVQDT